MRTFSRAGITANPDLGNFRRLSAGTRVRLWATASAADQASLVASMGQGGTELCDSYIPVEAVAGQGPTTENVPLFDVTFSSDGDLQLNFTFGTANVDFILGIGN